MIPNELRQRDARNAGFTLVEVITVCVIIGILLAVIFPAMGTAKRNAKKRQASVEARLLVDAVAMYRNTYGKWPLQEQDDEDRTYSGALQTNLVHTLIRGNPRNIQFFEPKEESLQDGLFVDPWGHEYVVAIDENGDGHTMLSVKSTQVDNQPVSLSLLVSNHPVAVVSWGPVPEDTSARIYSWQD